MRALDYVPQIEQRGSVIEAAIVQNPSSEFKTHGDVEKFFATLDGLSTEESLVYEQIFIEAALTTEKSMARIDRDILRELGVKPGHYYIFEDAIGKLRY